ncbi:MAG: TonB-dependent receptor [Lysobacterales bacterium]
MKSLPRFSLLSGAIVAALSASAFQPVLAQSSGGLEEIVVTARKRSESLQDVPAAVTVFTQTQLQRSGVERAADFIYLTPGVSIVDAAEVADTQVNIRGINGARDAENSFALILDGILMTNPAALNREYTNLSQIEILKGPQGALYGRNASAGAIIISTETPDDEFKGRLKASAAEDSTTLIAGSISGPINEGSMWYGLNADFRSSDGFYNNVFLGEDNVDDFENWNLGGRLIWENETTRWDAKLRYGEVDAASISFNAAFALPGFVAALTPVFGEEFASRFNENVNDHDFVFQNNIDPQNDQEALELSLKVEHSFANADLTGWLLYSDIENSLSADGTSGAFGFFFDPATGCPDNINALLAQGVSLPAPQLLVPVELGPILGPYTPTTCDGTQYQERNQEDLSFEVRLSSNQDSDLRWQAGVYYLDIDREVGVNTGIDLGNGVTEALFVPQGGANPTEQLVHDNFESEVIALFGNIDYDVSDTVELSFAARYDRESRDVNNLVPVDARSQFIDCDGPPFTGGDPINTGLCPSVNPNGVIAPKSETFSEFQPKVSVSWDVTDNTAIFSSLGRGFKSGGFNNQGAAATADIFINGALGIGVPGSPNEGFIPLNIQDQFDEETSTAFEVGFKSRLLDGTLSLEAAYYHTEVDDLQFFEFLVGAFGLLRVVTNVDEVEMDGVEFSANWAATDNLSLYTSAAFIDSEIKAHSARPDTVGNESPYTPDYTFNVGGRWEDQAWGDWNYFVNVDVATVGDTWFHVVQDQQRPTLFGPPGDYTLTERDSYTLVNVRAGLESNNWSIVGFVRNATDENYLEEVIPAPEFGGSFLHPGTLRRAGVEVTYSF